MTTDNRGDRSRLAAPAVDLDRSDQARAWVHEAIRKVEADANRSADTHLLRLPVRSCPSLDIYLKDESTHPTGSLKHRLARSLFLFGLCNRPPSSSACTDAALNSVPRRTVGWVGCGL